MLQSKTLMALMGSALLAFVSVEAGAQSALSAESPGGTSPRESGKQQVAFSLAKKAPSTPGLQFQIAYDAKSVKSVGLSSCLAGVPKTMMDSLTSCRNIADRGLVQIIISDITRNTSVPVGQKLGVIRFSGGSAAAKVQNVHMVDVESAKGGERANEMIRLTDR